MRQRLLKLAGIKFYLNPAPETRLPFIKRRLIKKGHGLYRKTDALPLQNAFKKQLGKFFPEREVRVRLKNLAKNEFHTRGLLSRNFKLLLRRDASYYPIFLGWEAMFLSSHSLQAEYFSWGVDFFTSTILKIYLGGLLAKNDGLLLHAAVVVKDGFACVFLGKSETGKTTVANLSKRYRVLDDEYIVIRCQKDRFLAFPFLWSGKGKFKSSCSQRGFPIKAIFFIKKARQFSLIPLSKVKALCRMLVYHHYIHNFEYLNDDLARKVFFTCCKFLQTTDTFEMGFAKDKNFWPELERYLKK